MGDDQQSDKPRVYVSAFFCQEMIREPDKDLLTAIRIADSFAAVPIELSPTFDGEGEPPPFSPMRTYLPLDAHAVIAFRSEAPVEFTASLRGTGPNGEIMPGGFEDHPCKIGADGAGYTLNANVRVPTDQKGTYWFEIYVDGELATKLPLRIEHPDSSFGQQSVKLQVRISESPC